MSMIPETTYADLLPIVTGPLPAGAILRGVALMFGEGVVLCSLPDNDVTPYVTWSFSSACRGFSHGRYRVEQEDAMQDFRERFGRIVGRQIA